MSSILLWNCHHRSGNMKMRYHRNFARNQFDQFRFSSRNKPYFTSTSRHCYYRRISITISGCNLVRQTGKLNSPASGRHAPLEGICTPKTLFWKHENLIRYLTTPKVHRSCSGAGNTKRIDHLPYLRVHLCASNSNMP